MFAMDAFAVGDIIMECRVGVAAVGTLTPECSRGWDFKPSTCDPKWGPEKVPESEGLYEADLVVL